MFSIIRYPSLSSILEYLMVTKCQLVTSVCNMKILCLFLDMKQEGAKYLKQPAKGGMWIYR